MAQGDSVVGICNRGLIALGEDPITSITEGTKAAILCNLEYDAVRRELLRAAPWECAKKLALLAASTTAPLFKWANAYPLPADYIRVCTIEGAIDTDDTTWETSDGQILTDQDAPLPLTYIYDLQDPTRFDPLLAKCLALSIAVAISKALTGAANTNDVKGQLSEAMGTGTLVDSQNDGPQEIDSDTWLRSRA